MTVKEIAVSVGKDESTISRWVKKTSLKMQDISCKMQEAKLTSVAADYTTEETLSIIESGMGKNAAGIWRANHEMSNQPIGNDRLSRLENMVEKLLTIVAGQIQPKPAEKLQLPSGISDRDAIRQLVNKAAKKENNDYQKIWAVLYEECYYRLHNNYKIRAANAGMGTLEYIDNIGDCDKVLTIAKELFGG